MQDFLNFVQKWVNAFIDIFKKLWHFVDDNKDILDETTDA